MADDWEEWEDDNFQVPGITNQLANTSIEKKFEDEDAAVEEEDVDAEVEKPKPKAKARPPILPEPYAHRSPCSPRSAS